MRVAPALPARFPLPLAPGPTAPHQHRKWETDRPDHRGNHAGPVSPPLQRFAAETKRILARESGAGQQERPVAAAEILSASDGKSRRFGELGYRYALPVPDFKDCETVGRQKPR